MLTVRFSESDPERTSLVSPSGRRTVQNPADRPCRCPSADFCALLRHLATIARDAGLDELLAEVFAENARC